MVALGRAGHPRAVADAGVGLRRDLQPGPGRHIRIGGYTYGFWAINLADNTGESLTAVLVAVLVGAVFAALLGYFMFYGNVTDVYVAIITLATSLVLFAFVNSTSGRATASATRPSAATTACPAFPGSPGACLEVRATS